MGLLKKIINENNIETNYHKVTNIINNENNSFIEVSSYSDQDDRNLEKEIRQVMQKAEITKEDKDFLNSNKKIIVYATIYKTDSNLEPNKDSAYEYLKTLEDFSDAEDC